jgi:copper ion binding protein
MLMGAAMATTKTYTVTGMTCAHCVDAVSAEVGQIPGVTDVKVDLATGAVTVTSDQPADDTAVATAVDEAGYEVAR